ncbi:hypothetical protein F4804DRAFT_349858 [Jackrogersella minutella]|nr:hypothetical protein F4804DRAFT_349858 [Jackrogersella minutella]
MSGQLGQNSGNPRGVLYVNEKICAQFPDWASANKSRVAATGNMKYSEFLVVSNWILRPEGLREFLDGLKQRVEGVQVTYDLENTSPKIRCLASEEKVIMALCQEVMDKIVQEELKVDLAASKKIATREQWLANDATTYEQDKREYLMAFAPAEIQAFVFQTAWIMPENLAKRGVVVMKLLPTDSFSRLQDLTGCTMMTSGDELAVYIGAESAEKVDIVERKLTTLAKYAAIPSQATTCGENFIYAEDEQHSLATFSYVAHGPKSSLRTFFLDRAQYRLKQGESTYGTIFEKGVIVNLTSHEIAEKKEVIPVAPTRNTDEPFKAFSAATGWAYKPKQGSLQLESKRVLPSVSFDPNPQVTSWITRLPRPELMLPHGDRQESPDLESGTNNDHSQSLSTNGSMSNPARSGVPERQDQSVRHQNNQAPLALPESNQEALHMVNSQPREVYPAPLRGGGGSSAQKRGKSKKNRGSGAQRGRGNRGTRPYRQRASGRQHPAGRSSMNPNGETGLVVDRTPSNFRSTGPQDQMTEEVESLQQRIQTLVSLPDEPKTMPVNPIANDWNSNRVRSPNALSEADDPPRVLRNTMMQQAGARTGRKQGYHNANSRSNDESMYDQDPQLIQSMSQKLVRMMSSLEVFPGAVSLRAELGRLCLTKINPNYVCVPGRVVPGQAKPLQDIKEALDKHHINSQTVIFTNILTAEAADANYLASMQDSLGKRMWVGDVRRTIYQVFCYAITKERKACRFTVEVDGSNFSYRVLQLPEDSCNLYVHCPKRSWDFRVTFTKSQYLGETFDHFAKDLVDCMRVLPQNSGVPLLEFLVKRAWQVEILLVRTRNVATYKRGESDLSSSEKVGSEESPSSLLEICEVHDMTPTGIEETTDATSITLAQHPGIQQLGQLGTWYEASVQCDMINKALQQNRDLELGEEVDWSPEKLQEAGAFEKLIRSATETVKKIDRVGYWGDNYQDAMIHSMPGTSSVAPSQRSTYAQSQW